jgi:hypothetical protein
MAAMFDLYSTFARVWLQPMRPLSSALVLGGTGDRATSLCNPVAQATTNRIQVGEMLLYEGVEAYKKEEPKFMRRLVAKWRTRGAVAKNTDRYQIS